MEKKNIYRITYQLANGSHVKRAETEEEMRKITEALDKKIEKGTCLGYCVTLFVKQVLPNQK